IYHGKQKHEDDFIQVLSRARAAGVEKMIITGTTLNESKAAFNLALQNEDGLLFSTVGCHPTQCQDFHKENPKKYYEGLLELAKMGIENSKVVAIGETGLDYDRLHFCPADIQMKYFIEQFQLAKDTGLPMFLHSRNTNGDMAKVLHQYRSMFGNAVVHSFTEDSESLLRYLDLGLYIGVNGCSLKQKEQLDVIKKIPLDRLILETDAPWCEIRPTHASWTYTTFPTSLDDLQPTVLHPSYTFPNYFWNKENTVAHPERFQLHKMVRGRHEPAMMCKVLLAVSQIRGEPVSTVAQSVYRNTMKLFFPKHLS
ncbi:TatD DNase, partial [Coelomomyces lativittatus]